MDHRSTAAQCAVHCRDKGLEAEYVGTATRRRSIDMMIDIYTNESHKAEKTAQEHATGTGKWMLTLQVTLRIVIWLHSLLHKLWRLQFFKSRICRYLVKPEGLYSACSHSVLLSQALSTTRFGACSAERTGNIYLDVVKCNQTIGMAVERCAH